MFIVYNDTKQVWGIEKKDGKGFTICNSSRSGKVSMFVADKDFAETLDIAGLTTVDSCDDIYKKNLVVSFDDKNLTPGAFATGKTNCAELAAIGITVPEGFRITSFYNANATVYAHDIIPDKYVDFIANFSKRGGKEIAPPRISITMVNDTEKTVISIGATWNKSKKCVNVFSKKLPFSEIPEKGKKGFINTTDFVARNVAAGKEIIPVFYPASPTHLIVVSESAKESLLKTIKEHKHWRSAKQYNIVVMEKEDELIRMVREGYSAVTLAVDKDMTVEAGKIDNTLMLQKAKELFDTVYLLGKNGFVYKAKIAGKAM